MKGPFPECARLGDVESHGQTKASRDSAHDLSYSHAECHFAESFDARQELRDQQIEMKADEHGEEATASNVDTAVKAPRSALGTIVRLDCGVLTLFDSATASTSIPEKRRSLVLRRLPQNRS